MKLRKYLAAVFLLSVTAVTAWWWFSPLAPATAKIALSGVETATAERNRILSPPKAMTVEVPVMAPSPVSSHGVPTAMNVTVPVVSVGPNAPLTRPNSALPFRFLPDNPEADAVAKKMLHDEPSHPNHPVYNFDLDSLALDTPIAWYEMSYDKLVGGVGVDGAAEEKGMRYLGRTADGQVVSATLVYYASQGRLLGASVVAPLGAQIAQALNNLANLVPMRQGEYEARLLSDDGTVRHFIWLKAVDGGANLFYEVSSDPEYWIGPERRVYNEQDFIQTYSREIEKIRTMEQQNQ